MGKNTDQIKYQWWHHRFMSGLWWTTHIAHTDAMIDNVRYFALILLISVFNPSILHLLLKQHL